MGNATYQRTQDKLSQNEEWLEVIYVVGALCFSIAIFNFRKPSTSQFGNLVGILGMLTSLVGTICTTYVNGYGYWIFLIIFVLVGGAGVGLAIKVEMTAMPMFVGFLNAMGGLAAALESLALYISSTDSEQQDQEWSMKWGEGGKRIQIYSTIFYLLGMIVGIITFTGSMVACLKLRGKFNFSSPRGKKTYRTMLKIRLMLTILLFLSFGVLAIVSGSVGLTTDPAGLTCFIVSMVISGFYGVYFVLCIGGADMPVVIALLNSLSGWSTVFAGLAFGNELMMIAGCFVGASGLILSVLMCKAMNRSMKNVMMGGFGGETTVSPDAAHLDAYITDYVSAAKVIYNSKLVYIVPGYGMAVSQAQSQVAQLVELINNSGREARCAVHPVAGRLPGHMNVLLAEANVPYNYVDDITANDRIGDADCVIIVGANDIYNPAAKFDKSSNIYGMEVLEVWRAKRTIVVKRSMRTGYAGIDNALFYYPQNSMLLGDAKDAISGLSEALKEELAEHDDDAVEAWIGGDDQRIAVRVEDEKRLKASGAAVDDDYEEDVPLCDSPLPLTLGILREPTYKDDLRIPIHIKDIQAMLKGKFSKWNVDRILVETFEPYDDAMFEKAEALVVDRLHVLKHSDIIVSISIPEKQDLDQIALRKMSGSTDVEEQTIHCQLIRDGQQVEGRFSSRNTRPILISVFGNPSGTSELQDYCRSLGITLLSMDIMPRVTTAQCMDVLSSSAKVAGFRSVIEACNQYGRLVGAEITAAGSYRPAKCLVVGVGVAGLAAIGDMHRLGGEVRAFDVRKECADQVKSMGGKFLIMDFGDEEGAGAGGYANIMSDQFIKKEMELLHEQSKECNLFILTAAIPGRKAPILIKDYHVADMQRGSVIIDLAAPTGGNCEMTRPGENYVTENGVKIIGKVDFVKGPSADISSEMLSANLMNWLDYNYKKTNSLNVFDVRDNLIRAIALTHQGQQMWPCPRPPAPAAPVIVESDDDLAEEEVVKPSFWKTRNVNFFNATPLDWFLLIFIFVLFAVLGYTAPKSLNSKLMILVLASWTGYLLVNGVTVALHTPLMSLTNAISGVVIVAAMLNISPYLAGSYDYASQLCEKPEDKIQWYCQKRSIGTIVVNAIALAAASMNVVGGFAVTQRMLKMFKAR